MLLFTRNIMKGFVIFCICEEVLSPRISNNIKYVRREHRLQERRTRAVTCCNEEKKGAITKCCMQLCVSSQSNATIPSMVLPSIGEVAKVDGFLRKEKLCNNMII